MPTCGSPGLFAAYRVLRRQSVPWHPPCALFRLICLRAPALPPLSRPLRFSRSDTSTFLRLLRSVRISLLSVSVPRFRLDSFRASLQPLSVSSFPVQFSRCGFAFRFPFRFSSRFPFRSRFQLISRSLFSAIPQNDTVKSFRQTPTHFRFAGFVGLTVFRLAVSRSVPLSWVPQSPAGLSGSPGSLPLSGFRLLASAPRFDLGCE